MTQVLVTENRGRCKSKGPKGRGNFRSQSKARGKVKCFYCDKEGHVKKNCLAWKNKLKEEKNQKKIDQDIAASASDEEVVIAIFLLKMNSVVMLQIHLLNGLLTLGLLTMLLQDGSSSLHTNQVTLVG